MTGGALNIAKSSWSVISPTENDTPNTIILERYPHEIEQIDESRKRYSSKSTFKHAHEITQLTGTPFPHPASPDEIDKYFPIHREHLHLRKNDPAQKQKSLGFYFSIQGTEKIFQNVISQMNDDFLMKIKKTQLSKPDIWRTFQSVHLPKVQYLFNGGAPSERFLDNETKRLTTELLPKLGINRNFPKSLLHDPTQRIGLEIPHLYTEAGIIVIK